MSRWGVVLLFSSFRSYFFALTGSLLALAVPMAALSVVATSASNGSAVAARLGIRYAVARWLVGLAIAGAWIVSFLLSAWVIARIVTMWVQGYSFAYIAAW